MTNQIFIVSDDQRFDLVKYMPNVMAMKARGTEFTMNRLNTSLCQPCRVSFMSGQLSKTTGVFANKETDLTDNGYDHTKTIAKGLSNAGVYCGLIGKYLNENGFSGGHPLTGTGWSYWRQQTGAGVGGAFGYDIWDGTSISNPGVYHLTYLYSQVVDFLATATEPWFLYVAPTSPPGPVWTRPPGHHKWSSL